MGSRPSNREGWPQLPGQRLVMAPTYQHHTASEGFVVGAGGIRRDCCASLALIWAPEAIVGIILGPTLGPAAWSPLRITTVGRPSRAGAVRFAAPARDVP